MASGGVRAPAAFNATEGPAVSPGPAVPRSILQELAARGVPVAPPTRPAWRFKRLGRRDVAIAFFVFAGALAARAPFIAQGETLLHSDEAIVGLMSQDIAEGVRFPIYFYGQRYMGALEAYVIALLRPFVDRPITALRLGPALFFAAFAVVQYLMLTRWYGRRAGLCAALVAVAASPMFVQWSVSARGGYIEILLWGVLLLWAYSEWFMPTQDERGPHAKPTAGAMRRLAFGLLIGSGFWINPTIVAFVATILVHRCLHAPLAELRRAPAVDGPLTRLGPLALPAAVLVAVLAMNVLFSVWVDQGRVRSQVLLGLLPPPLGGIVLAALALAVGFLLVKHTRLLPAARHRLTRNGPMIAGALVGASPAILYVLRSVVGTAAMEPAVPLGLRPLWRTAETLGFWWSGLPLLFGADPRPFVHLVSVGRDFATLPLDWMWTNVAIVARGLSLGAAATLAMIVLLSRRAELSRLFRLQAGAYSPFVLLALGGGLMTALYLLGGCALDFTTIRYLVPIWVFIPGLVAVALAETPMPAVLRSGRWLAVACLIGAYGAGQATLAAQIGPPHPLRSLADELVRREVHTAIAEPLDAHLLSYLTEQQCTVAEFESFWPRLAHLHAAAHHATPARYVVDTSRVDWSDDWRRGHWPGQTPPETKRFLWPRLQQFVDQNPDALVRRERLTERYELLSLRRAMPERTSDD